MVITEGVKGKSGERWGQLLSSGHFACDCQPFAGG